MSKKYYVYFIIFILLITTAGCTSKSSDLRGEAEPNTGVALTGEVEPGTIEQLSNPAMDYIAPAHDELAPTLGEDEVVIYYYRPDGDYDSWGFWIWAFPSGDGVLNWENGIMANNLDEASGVGYKRFSRTDTTLVGEEGTGVIPRNSEWVKDGGLDRVIDTVNYSEFVIIAGDTRTYIYGPSYGENPQIEAAFATDTDKVRVSTNAKLGLDRAASSNGFVVQNESGTVAVPVTDVVNYSEQDDRTKNYTNNMLVTLGVDLPTDEVFYISREGFEGKRAVIASDLLDATTPDDTYELGNIYSAASTEFRVWAPIATDVKVIVFDTQEDVLNDVNETITSMTKNAATGVWTVKVKGDLLDKYYKYQIANLGNTYEVCDIYAKCAGVDSRAGQIVDWTDSAVDPASWEVNYTNPFTGNPVDAVIYELHIRDFCVYNPDLSLPLNEGKFRGLATSDTLSNHLKDMGVTHVQLLPVFDYAETDSNTNYNWGYNPYHYNVPEGRYVVGNEADGKEAVKQFKELIKKLHDEGIAVVMDVVYNHTAGTGADSLFDMTVPYYYYRRSSSTGGYSNGSGCGNEMASNRKMFKRFMLDSLKWWVNEYHINGFRFDLAGLHEVETLTEITDALKTIDPHILVHGEPWTGGESEVVNGLNEKSKVKGTGMAVFNDNFRNAIKGAEFGGFESGHVQGVFKDSAIIKGLMGSIDDFTSSSNETINYVECHDNYTLFDKLNICANGGTSGESWAAWAGLTPAQQNLIKAQVKLSGAFVILAQGIPFINGGQEFMRTKRGDENSYISDDTTNGIDYSYITTTFSDVKNMYKGLFALRKERKAFRLQTAEDINSKVTCTSDDGITFYRIQDNTEDAGWRDITVIFNATKGIYDQIFGDTYRKIDVSSGSVVMGDDMTSDSIPPKSFAIYAK